MGRAKRNLIENLAPPLWPAGFVFGVGAFVVIRTPLPMLVKGNQFAPIVATFHAPPSWLVLVVGLMGAAMSWVGQQHRRKLLDAQQGLESITALGWRHFEQTAAAPPACPKRGKPMVERSNRKTGQSFRGCSAFPVCRGVR